MSALDLDLSGPIRTAILGYSGIVSRIATWEGEGAVFTRRPVPEGATYPLIVISPDVTVGDADWLNTPKPIVGRDLVAYGQKGTPKSGDQYRVVEQLGYLLRGLFHSQRFAISVPNFHVVQITARGPMPAPTEDDGLIARAVSLTIHLQALA